jgi:hypothetical protein
MATPEGRLQQAIQKRLAALGVYCFKVHGSALMPAGLPDLICCVDGMFVGIEVKLPQTKTNVSPKQVYQHGKIRDAGGVAVVCCSVGEVESLIASMRASLDD